MEQSALANLIRRERAITISAIAILLLTSWGYLAWMAYGMAYMEPSLESWPLRYAIMIFVMWVVMMVAMMTPSAAPMIITFAKINIEQTSGSYSRQPTGLFALAYFLVWIGFSAAATLAQWGLVAMAQLSPMMSTIDTRIGGAILIMAGMFQWTPMKHACLRWCRTPIGFLMTEWRDGPTGAFAMGLRHGLFCLGCCWALMLVLFAVGVMNLVWVAVLAVVVLLEKIVPNGETIVRLFGLGLIVYGVWFIVA